MSTDTSFHARWLDWRNSAEGKACLRIDNLKSDLDLENRLKTAFAEGWNDAPCTLPDVCAVHPVAAAGKRQDRTA